MPDKDLPEEFPSTPLKRTAIAAKAGMKVGANYAKYLARRVTTSESLEDSRKQLHSENARDIFKELTRLRGTALKFAQGISMDPGIIPEEFIEVMSQAQYSVPAMGQALVLRRIRQGLGAPASELFAEFDPVAVAAASIGQVHRAVLKDGRVAAVKIQYPNVRDTIDADLRIARGLASRVVKGNVEPFIEEIRSMMLLETDYENEGRNMEFFAAQYNNAQISTPRLIPELSSGNVLTMTFLEGVHIQEFMDREPAEAERNHFGQLLFDFSHSQIVSGHRTIHADFHPGNFLFQSSGKLGLIDFGCVKTLPEEFMNDFLRVFRGHLNQDQEQLEKLYTRLEILSPTHDAELRTKVFDFFLRMGDLIVLPYRSEQFDFGDPAFGEMVRKFGMEAMAFREREVIGSPHFVFVNRVVFGLLSMLTRLKAKVSTVRALATINDAIDGIEARAA
ncbi:MAG: putative unusual protein kinase regulating ubiquinone biosynthesis (AarF/ABC1/UbiB family) [Rhodothermales bacterium]|jgi:predicted unusual protein kinase regulating ubiquinone biosynthesis (AarF/ABC1/UbiB family)